eukprot:8476462-Alexandrium_andersonii.AAC.1
MPRTWKPCASKSARGTSSACASPQKHCRGDHRKQTCHGRCKHCEPPGVHGGKVAGGNWFLRNQNSEGRTTRTETAMAKADRL